MEENMITVTMTSEELKELCIEFAEERGKPKRPGTKTLVSVICNVPERGLHEVIYTVEGDVPEQDKEEGV